VTIASDPPEDDAEAALDTEDDDSGPVRRCLVTGERRPRETLIRFAVGPDNQIVPDVAASLPGRGLWLTAERRIVETAIAKRAFDRAARRKVVVPDGLADTIERLLARRCVDGIGFARRAGNAVAGFEKVSAMLKAGQGGLILAASDGAEDGRRKIVGLAPSLPVLDVLSAAELAAAFGREHVVHGAVGSGAIARKLVSDGARLAGFRQAAAAT
jgi:predicted RNA-binding protein YlxR (DUF448 family)